MQDVQAQVNEVEVLKDTETVEEVTGATEDVTEHKVDLDALLEQQKELLAKLEESNAKNEELLAKQEEEDKAKELAEFNTTLEDANLGSFKGIESLHLLTKDKQVEFIQNAVNAILVGYSYQPADVAQQSAYEEAMQKGDVKKAIDFKFTKLFGRK